MKVGDLVKWAGSHNARHPPPRLGIILGKWLDSHPDDTTHYWSVFMEGNMFNMDETYLEVISENR